MPVRVTIPTMIPAAAQATETIMALRAPFSKAVISCENSSRAKRPKLIRSGALWGSRAWCSDQRMVLAITLAPNVLMTATNPAIIGE